MVLTILETPVKTLIGFALGSLLSLGVVTSAYAAGSSVAAPVKATQDGVEVIVVTAKRPAAQPVAEQAIETIVVTAKRPSTTAPVRTPPAMAIEMPKLELAVAEPPVFRL
jgi:hypothetical protein